MKIDFRKKVFSISNEREFNETAMDIFRYQLETNGVYRSYVESLGKPLSEIENFWEVPFLPIEFFRTQHVCSGRESAEKVFLSSGTTGSLRSRHLVQDVDVYVTSMFECFRLFYGDPDEWNILGLMPSPEENPDSSLVFMTAGLMNAGFNKKHGFFLHDFSGLDRVLRDLSHSGEKTLLIGLSYALLDYSEKFPVNFPGLIVMETGGMKGQRKELIREELHSALNKGFGVSAIQSEYGMTELLSQAYARQEGVFSCPPWMKVMIREVNDPFQYLEPGDSGGINILDLANFNSCSFISTQDLGTLNPDGSFLVLGRFDHSELRGCNLMVF